MNRISIFPAIISVTALFSSVHAVVITGFTDPTSFFQVSGALPLVPPLDNGQVEEASFSVEGSLGTVTFTAIPPNTLHRGFDWTSVLSGNQFAVNGVEHLDLDLPASLFSFAIDFVEPSAGISDSTFQMSLSSSGNAIGSVNLNATDDVASGARRNFGTTAFDRIEIREIIGTNDDEFFGVVYGSTTNVPEPSTFTLYIVILFLLLMKRHR